MHDCGDGHLIDRWFPVTRGEEAVRRHVVHAQLLGEELAVWRDDGGAVNAWENRCAHRGVRLSIGTNTGRELQCRYHGWRYASGSGQCTFVPAHPDQAPPKVVRAKSYPCAEAYGYVWASLGAAGGGPSVPALDGREPTTLRSVFVRASAPLVAERLTGYRFAPAAARRADAPLVPATVRPHDPFTLEAEAVADGIRTTVVFLLQPVTQETAVVHAVLATALSGAARLAALRHHNDQLTTLRDAVEATGRRRLALAEPPAAPAGDYRALVQGRLSYGIAA